MTYKQNLTEEAIRFLSNPANRTIEVTEATVHAPGLTLYMNPSFEHHTLIYFRHSNLLRLITDDEKQAITLSPHDYYRVAFITPDDPTKVYRMYGDAE